MQSDNKEIYKITAERTGKSEQLYKDLGNFVFGELLHMIKEPQSLITKLKGVGYWYLRKQRMVISAAENADRGTIKPKDQYQSDDSYEDYLYKCKIHALFLDRLKDYEEYLKIKKEVEAQRFKTQVLLTPIDKSDEKFKID